MTMNPYNPSLKITASAPGSLMLLGEYGVLEGGHALVCAVDKRITVTLTPRLDDRIEIQSSLHGHYVTNLAEMKVEKPFHFVLAALQHYHPKMRRGCNIDIVSEFSDKVGFGSSAAVTVATLAALVTWLQVRIAPLDLVRQGRQVVRQIQGVGSGADIAASVYGGLVGYRAQPLFAEKYAYTHPITALYSGFKTPTVDAIKQVQQQFTSHPQLIRHIGQSISQCALEGIQAVRKEDWTTLGKVMTVQQGMMQSLGVSMTLLDEMVNALRHFPTMLGAKISGSGFGDCVVGLGALNSHIASDLVAQGVQMIPVAMSLQGVQSEKS